VSTNYYLDSPHNEPGHIGKWAAGHFTAKAPKGVNSFDEWAQMLEGHQIFAEHGIEYSPAEMLNLIKPSSMGALVHRRPRHDQGEFMERGVLFVRYEFC